MMNEISFKLRFKEYEFRRVKLMGRHPIIYTTREWIGKEVLAIPVPVTYTDRYIETHRNDKGIIEIEIPIYDTVITKEVKEHGRPEKPIGRIYARRNWAGLDCLVIEKPPLVDTF